MVQGRLLRRVRSTGGFLRRIVPRYVEQAAFRMRGSAEIIKCLCDHYPDTMRWISYTIDSHLLNRHNAEIVELARKDRLRK